MKRPDKKKSPPRKAVAKKRVKLNEAFRYALSFACVVWRLGFDVANLCLFAVAAGESLCFLFYYCGYVHLTISIQRGRWGWLGP